MSRNICTVCGDSYSANYNGQYPICHNCQWEIHSKLKEYWYCPICDKGYLLHIGVNITPCKHTHVYQVLNILNATDARELEKWALKEGKRFSEKVTRFILLNENMNCMGYSVDMQGHRTTEIVPCLKVTDVPFYFNSKEIIAFIAKTILDGGEEYKIKEVVVSDLVTPTQINEFFKCPNCGKYSCNATIIEEHSKLNRESGKLNSGYKCLKCNTDIVACYTCNKIIKLSVEQHNTCSDYCTEKEVMRLKSKNTKKAVGVSLQDFLAISKRNTKKLNCPYCKEQFVTDLDYYCEQLKCVSCKRVLNVCTDCRKLFYTDSREADWFSRNQLNLPRRCKACRKSKQ